MSSKDHYKQEIAKQFDLPERKSKIATLLKETDVYCLCRSSDSTRFMIACDYCEEWYHGDCVNITESDSRYIKHYYCPPCMEKNPSLEIEYKKSKPQQQRSSSSHKGKPGTSSDKKDDSKKCIKPKKSDVSYAKDAWRCGSCPGCLTVLDCFKCDVCIRNKYEVDSGKRGICRRRECLSQPGKNSEYEDVKPSLQILSERQLEKTDDEEDWVPSPIKASSKAKKTNTSKMSKKQQKSSNERTSSKARRRGRPSRRQYSSSDPEKSDDSGSDDDRQCYGLECTNAARNGSKYCSKECCIQLATARLVRLLPPRIEEWNLKPSVADDHNKRDLDRILKKQTDIREAIAELEKKRGELDLHIQRNQQITVDSDDDDEEPEEEGTIHCITCGHEITVKTCLKHMERCYNKYESQTSFGSIYKTHLEGIPIFCDYYNPANGTYCKRLAVLCPEHSKEPKIRDTEICGCPMGKDIFQDTEEICKLRKKRCNKHFCWEKLRRAEIDMERVRHWLKLDELVERERQVRQAMSNRGGVVGLLVHSTFDHELGKRIQQQMKNEPVDVEGDSDDAE